jgi:mono/diheme cytochrome c family protein
MRMSPIALMLILALSTLDVRLCTVSVAEEPSLVRQVYEARCAFCHGVEGKGDGVAGQALSPPPTNFAAADFWKTATEENLRDAITNGRPGTAMVPFGKTLKPEEIDALVEYLRTFAPQ